MSLKLQTEAVSKTYVVCVKLGQYSDNNIMQCHAIILSRLSSQDPGSILNRVIKKKDNFDLT